LGGRAVRRTPLPDPAAEHLRVVGPGGDDLRRQPGLLQRARDALQRAAGPETGNPIVEPLAGEVGDYLLRRRRGMHVGVRLVLELPAQEPAVRLGELDGLLQHAGAFFGGRRQHDLRAEEAQQLAALDAEAFRHRDDERVALLRADHREPDAGVAARRLDDGLAGRKLAGLLRALDHGERHPVLDRAHRVEGLDLHVDVHARRGQLAELNERRVADRRENVVETGHRFLLEWVALADHPRGGAWQRPWKRAWFLVPGALDFGPGAVGARASSRARDRLVP